MMSKPDFTAWFVLQGLIAAVHHKPLRRDERKTSLPFLLLLAKEASTCRPISRFIHIMPYSWQYFIGNLITSPDRLQHFYLRKHEIEEQTRQLISEERIKQVVVLGAGLDVLTLSLATDFPAVKFIEIDLPASQQFKLKAFQKQSITPSSNIEYIDGDLCNSLVDILEKSISFARMEKTLWIAEGVLMFLPENKVANCLNGIVELSDKDSTFIFTTFSNAKKPSKFSQLLQSFYLNQENCPYKWYISCEDIPLYLEDMKFKITKQYSCKELFLKYNLLKHKNNQPIGDDMHIANI